MPDPNDPRPSGKARVSLTGEWRGFPCTIDLDVDVRKLDASVQYLHAQGFEPPPRPTRWETTPDGLPICPRHGVPMKVREKQGDTWHSHKVTNDRGEELWCKGYAAPDSPGYFVDMEPPR